MPWFMPVIWGRGMGNADVIDKVLAVGATVLLALVLIAIAKGSSHWGEVGLSVWAHLSTVSLALAIAPIQLLRPKGDRVHRMLGRVWAVLLLVTALISFDIRVLNDGKLSPIHILSVVTIVCVPTMVWAARTRRIRVHQGFARGITIGALLVAGYFTLLPSRDLGGWLFG